VLSLGSLISVAASEQPELLAQPTMAALIATGQLDSVGVAAIDPAISDTAATQEAFGLDANQLANCVIVSGKREGIEKIAACVILASTRADINSVLKKLLDVRKASFLAMDRAVELSGMEYGGITPIGLPAEWPIFIDSRVAGSELVVVGSGIRASKILVPGAILAGLPGAQVIENLARPIAAEPTAGD
jgi:prolyl-tRNA editing enzyme YbaK/EbsC (Cys-tRNA(Pro) deacylase)